MDWEDEGSVALSGNSQDGPAEILRILLGATPAPFLDRLLASSATERPYTGSTEYQYQGTVAPARNPVHNRRLASDRLRVVGEGKENT